MRTEATLETLIGLVTAWQLAGVETSIPWANLVQQYGGLALAVWLVIHHTMVNIPRMQLEAKAEREALVKAHREELDVKRADYLRQLSEQAAKHREEVETLRADFLAQIQTMQRTFEQAVERQVCRFERSH